MTSSRGKIDYEKNKEGYFRRAREQYARSNQNAEARLNRMLVEAKSRAKKKNLEFSITVEDVKWNTHCPIFKEIELVLVNPQKGGADNSPSLDRIKNDLGYVKGNVRIISNKANKLKNKMTKEECKQLYEGWECI